MTASPANTSISLALISLLKGVVYRDSHENAWRDLVDQQAAVADYAALIGLELIVDEAEGHAFLRQIQSTDDDEAPLPRLVARRQLSYPVSLLLALLRKKLAEHDASGDQRRLVLSRDGIVDLLRLFLPETANQAKLIDRVGMDLNKIIEMGFVRRLKDQKNQFEVRRILKSCVDAHWLAERQVHYWAGAISTATALPSSTACATSCRTPGRC
ncbi:MAG: DUF4194 domain-containing protein [Wenzhouxiangellaceae bacterium]|nr:DUF4194 domain-containing protein [Wenzhouxiangellaceae bacterium]